MSRKFTDDFLGGWEEVESGSVVIRRSAGTQGVGIDKTIREE